MHLVPPLHAASSANTSAPWWFAGTIGLIGIALGVILKFAIDARATRASNRREDDLRFIQDKSVAYAELLAACGEVADAEHEGRLLEARIARSEERTTQELAAGQASRVNDYDDDLEALDTRRTNACRELNRVAAIVDLIGPEPVTAAAKTFVSRAHHPHQLARRLEAEATFIDSARADLGYPPTSHLPSQLYEDYIPYDDPDSGIDRFGVRG